MSFSKSEADAAMLVQKWVNYALNLGLANAGPDFLLLTKEQMTIDLCTHNDMFEGIEPEKIQPYVAVWRKTSVTVADVLTANGARQHGEPVD